MKRNFNPFPVLKKEQLQLRALRFDDADAFFQLLTNKENNRYLQRLIPSDKEAVFHKIKSLKEGVKNNQWLFWVIEWQGQMIGTLCLWHFSKDGKKAEIGYELAPAFQQKGYMGKSMDLVLNFGFQELQLERIFAYTNCQNQPSIQLLNSRSFEFKGKLKNPEKWGFQGLNPLVFFKKNKEHARI